MSAILLRGSKGAAVKALQEQLGMAQTDGIFGPKTQKAVEAFQRKLNLVVDGKVGPQTREALKQATTGALPAREEPTKNAIKQPVPEAEPGAARAKAPSNSESLQLLSTARPISEIIVHCTATPEGKDYTVADIRSWHKQRGWSDIGYHYVVYRDGRVMTGRPVGQVGAHVRTLRVHPEGLVLDLGNIENLE
jgi:peptidoglycan hydrolase-like protein with peptidoglycan-binding domain